ncbi:hypothetical protein [Flavobacterium muglaense]|uniref:Uncharacterized protein n=1 Tax=Flavobacterium muglaense TaxID=2764716 RepID=A0A923MX47_9FLAO|nr:hypothetical protein [Flavobacterium muglaense]MBC5836583.1 hypothetical protein [Flavobacterium muglaense]MBC5843151.1 hypothetical protein [Flavobacterium muglaense]
MKTIKTILVLAVVLLSINSASAQYGNNGYGGGNNGYGGGRMSQMSQMNQAPSDNKPKEIPVEVTVGKIMERITPALSLDALQEIAIANVITESIRSQAILMKDKSGQEQKIEEIKALSETTDRKINEFLNADQKVKYKALNEESKNPKKSRRNR